MEIVGKLFEKHDAIKRTETFTVREFIVEVENARNPQYNDFIQFQLTNDRCNIVDNYEVGAMIQVTFDIRGRRWQSPEGRIAYFNTLNAWRVEHFQGYAQQPAQPQPVQPSGGYQPGPAPVPPVGGGVPPTGGGQNPADDLPF